MFKTARDIDFSDIYIVKRNEPDYAYYIPLDPLNTHVRCLTIYINNCMKVFYAGSFTVSVNTFNTQVFKRNFNSYYNTGSELCFRINLFNTLFKDIYTKTFLTGNYYINIDTRYSKYLLKGLIKLRQYYFQHIKDSDKNVFI